jgi:hypothetical protein
MIQACRGDGAHHLTPRERHTEAIMDTRAWSRHRIVLADLRALQARLRQEPATWHPAHDVPTADARSEPWPAPGEVPALQRRIGRRPAPGELPALQRRIDSRLTQI